MKYAIITVSNGTYKVEAEGIKTIEAGKVAFHGKCQVFWNAPDVIDGTVMLADENLDAVEGYKEHIHHESAQTTED